MKRFYKRNSGKEDNYSINRRNVHVPSTSVGEYAGIGGTVGAAVGGVGGGIMGFVTPGYLGYRAGEYVGNALELGPIMGTATDLVAIAVGIGVGLSVTLPVLAAAGAAVGGVVGGAVGTVAGAAKKTLERIVG